MYKGADIAIVASLSRALLQLPVYDFVKRSSFVENSSSEHFKQRIGTAFLSGMVVTMMLYPLDTIKRSMQTNGGRGFLTLYSSSFDCAKKLYSSNGFAGLYKGAHLCLLTSIIQAYA